MNNITESTHDFSFGTKAETLEALSPFQDSFSILPFTYFTKEKWLNKRDTVLNEIAMRFLTVPVVVRSSAANEDGPYTSLAGAFESRLNVNPQNLNELQEAIDFVFQSYPSEGSKLDQVLIQEMVKDTVVSGVIMTHMIDDGSPYYVFNYDDDSGSTDSITGGTGAHKTVLIYRQARENDCDSPRVRAMFMLAKQLENICNHSELDIEFAMGQKGELYLLQLRRIANACNWPSDCLLSVLKRMPQVESFVRDLSCRRAGLFGDSTILGNMPDWNPAEIIGVHPSPLASSLYRYLITDKTWHSARTMMGYRLLPKTDLMVMIAGSPYIDVRASFNSFLPEGCDPKTAEKLVNAWLYRLSKHPELHDKVEFEIVPTIYDFDFESLLDQRYPDLLSESERENYAECLHRLTENALDLSDSGSLKSALTLIEELKDRQKGSDFIPSMESGPISIVTLLSAILDNCINYGTLPFSIVARHGFIVESFFRSMVRLGAIDEERVQQFKNSFPTILGKLSDDSDLVNEGKMSIKEYLECYGHLRPGTYDIMAPSYRERRDLFGKGDSSKKARTPTRFDLTANERLNINKLFRKANFTNIDADGFLEYAKIAIAGREYAKFIFTKSLSAALDNIIEWGKFYNMGREELSLLKIEKITETAFNSYRDNPTSILIQQIDKVRLEMKSDRLLKMGYLIRETKDLHVVPIHRSSPNYVTDVRVEGKVLHLDSKSTASMDLAGKIICIENADPGFDWIFTKNIAGLITKYGGANSHMTIRCAEVKLPAAIGCGEMLFSSLLEGEKILLSCKEKAIRV